MQEQPLIPDPEPFIMPNQLYPPLDDGTYITNTPQVVEEAERIVRAVDVPADEGDVRAITYHNRRLIDAARGGIHRFNIGLPLVDQYMPGPAPGQVAALVGASQTGKSMLINQLLSTHRERRALYMSYEMSHRQVILRLLAHHFNYNYSNILSAYEEQDKSIRDERLDRLQLALNKLEEEYPSFDVTYTPRSPSQMADELNRFKELYGGMPELLIIDSFNRVPEEQYASEGWRGSREKFVELASLASGLNMAIWVIHHTNKSNGASWMVPSEQSLQDAGMAEIDLVLGVHTPWRDPKLAMAVPAPVEEQMRELYFNIIKDRETGRYIPANANVRYRITGSLRFAPPDITWPVPHAGGKAPY